MWALKPNQTKLIINTENRQVVTRGEGGWQRAKEGMGADMMMGSN